MEAVFKITPRSPFSSAALRAIHSACSRGKPAHLAFLRRQVHAHREAEAPERLICVS